MRYLVLATDYDGTLARHGQLDDAVINALERLRASGRRLIMVTGRQLEDLQRVCLRLDLFDIVVAENGGLLYWPAEQREQVLGEAPPPAFIAALQARGVAPLGVGRCIIATWEPHEVAALEVIRELGLELQLIFNKGAVMILPAGVNKASGLQAALDSLSLSPHNVVAIGDAENDHAFLSLCECAVAVANALPTLKERADWVTHGDHGAGVVELVDELLDNDMAARAPLLQRHTLLLGTSADGAEQRLDPYATNLLISGTSGSGKSTLATALLDQLVERSYQVCIIDPEGDYDSYEHATVLGDPQHEPTIDEICALLATPSQQVVVNLLGVKLERRPEFFDRLLPRLQDLRGQTGRPHWIVVDEAHHLLHHERAANGIPLPQHPHGMLYITVHPSQMAPAVLETIDQLAIIGDTPDATLAAFCEAVGDPVPHNAPTRLAPGETAFWRRGSSEPPLVLHAAQPTSEHQRHIRKYAEGDMKENSFVFRGPEGKLKLRAQNLIVFLQLADGVDDQTWLFHLSNSDYVSWFRNAVKDPELADEAAQIAAEPGLDADQSRQRIRGAIERRYTAPAG